jgi:hypothetical protein
MDELKGILKREREIAKAKRDLAEKEGNVERYNYYDGKVYGLAMAIVEISYNDKLKTKKP